MAEIEELFLDPKQGFTNPTDIWRKLKSQGYNYTLNQVREFLNEEETLQRHAPKKKSPYHITAEYPDHKWQADLIDVSSTAATNRNTNFLLTIIDVLTKYAFVVPLKNKKEKTIADSFENIFENNKQPDLLVTDNGTEFKNKTMKRLTDDYNIVHVFNRAGDKTSQGVVERFNRTIMTRIQKYLTATGEHNYVDTLPDLVENYNNTYHSTIKMTPFEAQTASLPPISPSDVMSSAASADNDIQTGDTVRRLLNKSQFSKGYKPNWTSKVYVVESKHRQYYKLKGHDDLFKASELQLVGHEETKEKEKGKRLEADERPEFVPPPKEAPKTRGKRIDYKQLSQTGKGASDREIRYIKKEIVKERAIPLDEADIYQLAKAFDRKGLAQVARNINYIDKEYVNERGLPLNRLEVYRLAYEFTKGG